MVVTQGLLVQRCFFHLLPIVKTMICIFCFLHLRLISFTAQKMAQHQNYTNPLLQSTFQLSCGTVQFSSGTFFCTILMSTHLFPAVAVGLDGMLIRDLQGMMPTCSCKRGAFDLRFCCSQSH